MFSGISAKINLPVLVTGPHSLTMPHSYRYIGAAELARFDTEPPARCAVHGHEDVRRWIAASEPSKGRSLDSTFTATFIIAENGVLWIADRHSEHVQCARGLPVRSAGEITFRVEGTSVSVDAVTNQSTGYCPEPESWPAVEKALARAGLARPPYWTNAFVFRQCPTCGMTNIVKDGVFECGVCGSELPQG